MSLQRYPVHSWIVLETAIKGLFFRESDRLFVEIDVVLAVVRFEELVSGQSGAR